MKVQVKLLLAMLSLLTATVMVLTACAKPTPAPAPAPTPAPPPVKQMEPLPGEVWPKSIVMATHVLGSSANVLGIFQCQLYDKYVKGIKFSTIPTNGTTVNCGFLTRQEVQIAMIAGTALYNAYRGLDFQKELGPAPVRSMYHSRTTAYLGNSLAKSGIKTIKDLRGKRVSATPAGSAYLEQLLGYMLEVNGMKLSDVTLVNLANWTEQSESLIEGKVDAIFMGHTPPSPGEVELAFKVPINFLGITQEEAKEVAKRSDFLYTPVVTPAGMYRGLDKDIITPSWGLDDCAHVSLPEGLVYAMTAAIMDHLPELWELHPGLKGITLEQATQGRLAPYHTGAIKYYKEKGLWGPEEQASQKSLLDLMGYKQ